LYRFSVSNNSIKRNNKVIYQQSNSYALSSVTLLYALPVLRGCAYGVCMVVV